MTANPSLAWPILADTDRCPCLSGLPYGECCAPAHAGTQPSVTAERLMRSRYSAFVLGDEPYLLATWHSSTRPVTLGLDPAQRFYRLDILSKAGGGMLDRSGTVEFVARFRLDGRAGRLHETSRFVSEGGRWFYVDGDLYSDS
ncbi:YchJ family protein [Subtercola sp. PAMC28395]|uniref:YchJ family protein n=1 Tax=Subtercola sp. PAMC28395 TaxID=2846775 RepID=UPI001C0C9238|nr:YchJ family protein [Subtercola sp. PAMC28395]QWT25329.1 YchJ family protein [Subtercola sp. PAMC28395]